MRTADIFKTPFYAAELATGGKSFRDNPLIGSRRLNEAGLHVKRIELAERMADARRRRLAHLVAQEDRAAYARDGFIQKRGLLAESDLEGLRAEVATTPFDSWDMRQGNAVTRFIPLPPKVLKNLPYLRNFVWSEPFQNGLRYVGSTNGDPLVYLHIVMTDPKVGKKADPQTAFHSDTFHPTAKAWFFLYDIDDAEGPFTYVPGSHRLTPERLAWEHEQSLTAATHKDRLHARGSFRLRADELDRLNYPEPLRFAVPGNTLVVADTHGFHARATSERPSVRVGIYGSLRRNPFLPWTGMDLFNLPGLRGRQSSLFVAQKDLVTRLKGRPVSHRYAGKVLATEPSKF
ncbi:phytanoyl-CoA dioxygenase family protein [Labrenzia sp. OB1]|uniref:phytanoyl-CoA dioxygenase family protein n=1 Tax=Labrenzia sp. OB1 TaxID=1561204 RepID=UPI0007B1BF19|nr:phytanoyl-CoA dioxygenase family protein [Labrenzia sp. OB1]KZM48507.1 phytanoyl-CoA dioxygenase [Labrenzia sp. OB1]